jgi:hypothetical protein
MATAAKTVENSSEGLLKLTSHSTGFLLTTIFKSANEIQEISKRIKANKYQCVRLSQRIQTLVDLLPGYTTTDTLNPSMKLALTNFANFLQICIDFMNQFTQANFVKRLFNNKSYQEKFMNLHTEFSQHATDLNLGVMLTGMLVHANQHQHDQHLDSTHIEQLLSLENIKDIECDSSSVTSDKQVCYNKIKQTQN